MMMGPTQGQTRTHSQQQKRPKSTSVSALADFLNIHYSSSLYSFLVQILYALISGIWDHASVPLLLSPFFFFFCEQNILILSFTLMMMMVSLCCWLELVSLSLSLSYFHNDMIIFSAVSLHSGTLLKFPFRLLLLLLLKKWARAREKRLFCLAFSSRTTLFFFPLKFHCASLYKFYRERTSTFA